MSFRDKPRTTPRGARGGMVGPGGRKKCCRSTPRCRACPVTLAAEVQEMRDLARRHLDVPPHLAGVPESLHKYEPLLRRSWEQRQAEERAAKERAARADASSAPLRVPDPARDELA